jgi:DNA adenine methylase
MTVQRPWIVTYDDVPEIRGLYRDRRQFGFGINYSLHEKRVGSELLIVSKGLKVPESAKSRQVNRPQYRTQVARVEASA